MFLVGFIIRIIRQYWSSILKIYVLVTDYWAEKLYSCALQRLAPSTLFWPTLIILYGYVKLVTRLHLLSSIPTWCLRQGQLYFYQYRLLNSHRFHKNIIFMEAKSWQKKFNFLPSLSRRLEWKLRCPNLCNTKRKQCCSWSKLSTMLKIFDYLLIYLEFI